MRSRGVPKVPSTRENVSRTADISAGNIRGMTIRRVTVQPLAPRTRADSSSWASKRRSPNQTSGLRAHAHERACFSAGPWPTVTEGAAIRSRFRGLNLGIAHFIEKTEAAGHQILPGAWATAQPGGKVTDDAFERMAGKLTATLEHERPDAVYLELHGAMVTQSHDDGEGELLRRVRSVVGLTTPILVSLDLHANVSPQM